MVINFLKALAIAVSSAGGIVVALHVFLKIFFPKVFEADVDFATRPSTPVKRTTKVPPARAYTEGIRYDERVLAPIPPYSQFVQTKNAEIFQQKDERSASVFHAAGLGKSYIWDSLREAVAPSKPTQFPRSHEISRPLVRVLREAPLAGVATARTRVLREPQEEVLTTEGQQRSSALTGTVERETRREALSGRTR